jgi:PAT family beta-lactamase induction signal transducer AmpG
MATNSQTEGKTLNPVVLEKEKEPKKALLWVYTTYFAEGLPYAIIRILSTFYFTDIGVKERYLGYLNFLSIPWTLKFIWAPFLDLISTKRRWMIIIQFLFSLVMMAVATACYFAYVPTLPPTFEEYFAFGYELPPLFSHLTTFLVFISLAFVVMAFIAATNDISIDAYYLEGLKDPKDQAAYSGDRVAAYRLAMIFSRSGVVAFVAYMTYLIQQKGNVNLSEAWAYGFGVCGLTMFLLACYHFFKLPEFENKRQEPLKVAQTMKSFAEAFSTYLKQEKVVLIIIFIILYKIGDEILFSMNTPFMKRELKVSNAQMAWIAGIVGAVGAVLGAMAGGYWIKKQGLRKAIWPLTILMNFNIWAYTWLAYAKPDPTTIKGISLIAFVYFYEQVASGLGSAALTVYIMRTCSPSFKASHYAFGTAIMLIPAAIIGGFAGQMIESMGYVNFFIFAFLASIPAMLVMFFVPIKDEQKATAPSGT